MVLVNFLDKKESLIEMNVDIFWQNIYKNLKVWTRVEYWSFKIVCKNHVGRPIWNFVDPGRSANYIINVYLWLKFQLKSLSRCFVSGVNVHFIVWNVPRVYSFQSLVKLKSCIKKFQTKLLSQTAQYQILADFWSEFLAYIHNYQYLPVVKAPISRCDPH